MTKLKSVKENVKTEPAEWHMKRFLSDYGFKIAARDPPETRDVHTICRVKDRGKYRLVSAKHFLRHIEQKNTHHSRTPSLYEPIGHYLKNRLCACLASRAVSKQLVVTGLPLAGNGQISSSLEGQ